MLFLCSKIAIVIIVIDVIDDGFSNTITLSRTSTAQPMITSLLLLLYLCNTITIGIIVIDVM